LVAITPVYVTCYFWNYVRPSHHPPSAGLVESARIALEAQSMAFGPAATGLWPVVGLAVCFAGGAAISCLAIPLRRDVRNAGLLLYLAAGAAVAFGIGWGRSGFLDNMGFAWRYGWITLPFVFACYFTWLVRGGRVAAYGTYALAGIALTLAPVNSVSGFLNGEKKVREFETAWESDVRAGWMAEQVVEKHFPEYRDAMRQEVIAAMWLMRDHRYAYYEALGRETP